MDAASVLRRLHASGVGLRVEDGNLQCQPPPGGLPAALKADILANKDELLSLLMERPGAATMVPSAEAGAAMLRLWGQAALGVAEPRALVRRLWPSLAAQIDEAEECADAAGGAYQRGDIPDPVPFRRALGEWEASWTEALRRLRNGCHVCGAVSVLAAVIDHEGVRQCRVCFAGDQSADLRAP